MAARKPKVIVTRKLPDPVETRMRELFDTELNLTDEPLTRAQLADAVGRCDVLVPTITDRIDATLLEKAGPKLKVIANFGPASTTSTSPSPSRRASRSPTPPAC